MGKLTIRKKCFLLVVLAIAITVISLFPATSVFAANDDAFVNSIVIYNEEKTEASIQFNLNSGTIDKEKYEISSVVSNKESTVLYEKDKIVNEDSTKSNIYKVSENGDYEFTVTYIEKEKTQKQGSDEEVTNSEEEPTDNENNASQKVELLEISSIQKTVKVTIDGLKTYKEEKKSSEIEEDSMLENISNGAIDNIERSDNLNNQGKSDANSYINLKDSFTLSNLLSTSKPPASIDFATYPELLKIDNNQLSFGRKGFHNMELQIVGVTSKYTIDFKRSFKISGNFTLLDGPEGFAISFHNKSGYMLRSPGGGLGFYGGDQGSGIGSGYVLEIDGYNNTEDSATATKLGENRLYGLGTEHRHTSINITGDNGHVSTAKSDYNIPKKLFGYSNDFEIEWDANSETISMKTRGVDGDSPTSISQNNSSMGYQLKNTDVYMSIASGINYNQASTVGNDGTNKFSINSFQYTDMEPSMTSSITPASNKVYAVEGEKVKITHEIKNLKSAIEVSSLLNLGYIKLKSGAALPVSNIKTGYKGSTLTSYTGTFNSSTPIPVKLPASSGTYLVEYDVTIPAGSRVSYGEFDSLDYQVLLGTIGMSQVENKGSLTIKTKPFIGIITSGTKSNRDFDVKNVTSPTELNEDKMWENLSVKIAGTNTPLIKGQTSYSNFDLTYSYVEESIEESGSIDTKELGTAFPSTIDENKHYILKLSVTDKSDSSLTNIFANYIIVSKYISIYPNSDGTSGYVMKANDPAPLSVNEMKKKTMEELKTSIISGAKAKVFTASGVGSSKLNQAVDVDLSAWDSNGDGIPDKATGSHNVAITSTALGITVNQVVYDLRANMVTSITPNSAKGLTYAIAGETFKVQHKIANKANAPVEVTDYLKLNYLRSDVTTEGNWTIKANSIKVGSSGSMVSYTGDFDSDTKIPVKYLAEGKPFLVEYEVEVPSDMKYYSKKLGYMSELCYSFALENSGIENLYTAYHSVYIGQKNYLGVGLLASSTTKGYDFLKVSSVNDITTDKLWHGLYTYSARKDSDGGDTRTQINLNKEQKVYSGDYTVGFEYFKETIDADGNITRTSLGETFPTTIDDQNAIYSVEITSQPIEDERLASTFVRRIMVANYSSDSTGEYIITANKPIGLSETKLHTLTDQQAFKNLVIGKARVLAFKVKADKTLESVTGLDLDITKFIKNGKLYKEPGTGSLYNVGVSITADPSTKIDVMQDVVANDWSYDSPDRTETNGASGFVVIPKRIELKNNASKPDNAVANAEIYFADYENAIDVKYDIRVDSQFVIKKQSDISKTVTVTSSSSGAINEGAKLYLGILDNTKEKGNGIDITFSASREELDKTRDKWDGNVTFYFTRK